jgi:hypothetical protein
MTPNNGANSSEGEMNKWAEAIRWFGICSLLPYLLFGILFYTEKNPDQLFFFHAENVLAVLCVSWGIIFGSVTLISGIVAMKQIYGSKYTEKGILSAVLGIVFGVLAIVSNLVTVFIIFASE